jgi:hypothetical protein
LSFTFIYVPAFETQGCKMLRVYLPNWKYAQILSWVSCS